MIISARRLPRRLPLRRCLRCGQFTAAKHSAATDRTATKTTTTKPSTTYPDDSIYLSQGQLISTPSSFHVPQLPPEDSEQFSRLPPYRNRWFTEYGFSTTATTTAGISPDWHSASGGGSIDSENSSRKRIQNTVIDFENTYFIPRVQKPIIRRALFDEVHSASPLGHVVTVERAKAFAEANATPLFVPAAAAVSSLNKEPIPSPPPLEFRFVTGGYAYHSSKNPPRSILTSALPHALFAGPAAEQPVTLSDGSSTTIMKRAGEGMAGLNAVPIESFDKLEFGDLTSMACGEDSVVGATQLLGLADGVSGWSHRTNGHAALWSRLILHRTVSHYVDNYNRYATSTTNLLHDKINRPEPENGGISRSKDLLDALDDGFADTKQTLANQKEIGSSTLILAVLDQSTKTVDSGDNSSSSSSSRDDDSGTKSDTNLEVLNIGDSSIWVFRDGEVVFTVEHAPKLENCPRQLGSNTTDVPSTLVSPYTIPVQAGDLVLLSSDGVSDNLWITEITSILREKYYATRAAELLQQEEEKSDDYDSATTTTKSSTALQRAADAIVLMATDRSFDNFAVCPYQLNAAPYSTGGGKTDDISVLLAEIVERPAVE